VLLFDVWRVNYTLLPSLLNNWSQSIYMQLKKLYYKLFTLFKFLCHCGAVKTKLTNNKLSAVSCGHPAVFRHTAGEWSPWTSGGNNFNEFRENQLTKFR